MKPLKTLLLFLCVSVLFSCNSDDNGLQQELIGKWANTIELQQQDGYRLDEIEIFDDFTFKQRVEIYGFYEGQTREDLSQWQEYSGLLREYEDQLTFSVKSTTWFISIQDDPGPMTSELEINLFGGGANYRIENNILTITYISYATDVAVETVVQYVKVN